MFYNVFMIAMLSTFGLEGWKEEIIFDETFGSDREDWQKMASKIEYIGREVEGSPLFCLLKW